MDPDRFNLKLEIISNNRSLHMKLAFCRTGHFNHKFLHRGWEFQIQIYTAIYTCICVSLVGIHLFFSSVFPICVTQSVYKMENMKYRVLYEYESHRAEETARKIIDVYGDCVAKENTVCFGIKFFVLKISTSRRAGDLR
jgi:hypothetical protein